MQEILHQILYDLEGIKSSLEVIAQKGIPIIDTYSPITTFVNILTILITTSIGTGIGALFTMRIFKSQEKMRIREELKLKFYNGYEELYMEFYENFSVLKSSIKTMNNMLCQKGCGVKHYIDTIETGKDVIENRDTNMINNLFNSLHNTLTSLNILNEYMENQSPIIKFNYKNQYKDLDRIRKKLDELDCYVLICKQHKDSISNIEYVDRYKNVSNEIICLQGNGELKEINDSILDIHKEIRDEFIGKYFKN